MQDFTRKTENERKQIMSFNSFITIAKTDGIAMAAKLAFYLDVPIAQVQLWLRRISAK